jgi:putative tryptophan/tyrosine transport system substrate-binding protein
MQETPIGRERGLHAAAQQLRRWLCACVFLLLLAALNLAYAAGVKAPTRYTVLVLIGHQTGIYQEVVDGIRAGMRAGNRIELQVLPLADYTRRAAALREAARPDLVVTVGTEAAQTVLQEVSDTPVCMILIPRTTSVALVRNYEQTPLLPRRAISTVYIDQPLQRQLRLVRLTLPRSRRLGVVYGPHSREGAKQLKAASDAGHWDLHAVSIDREKELFGALTRVLDNSDVLLALPDPLVYNQHTTQNILLETYRQRKPLIGYSHAYVAAGALAAVYSTPRQIGRQAGELVAESGGKGTVSMPAQSYPKYFTVEVNQQVAHSLGLTIATATELQSMIEETLER